MVTAVQVRDQDVDESGSAPRLARGVAKDRRISVEDPRHAAWPRVPIGAVRCHWQGHRAGYHGARKNLFDLRRAAIVHNLHVAARVLTTHRLRAGHLTT